MSVCLSVRGQVEILASMKVSKGSRRSLRVPKGSLKVQGQFREGFGQVPDSFLRGSSQKVRSAC